MVPGAPSPKVSGWTDPDHCLLMKYVWLVVSKHWRRYPSSLRRKPSRVPVLPTEFTSTYLITSFSQSHRSDPECFLVLFLLCFHAKIGGAVKVFLFGQIGAERSLPKMSGASHFWLQEKTTNWFPAVGTAPLARTRVSFGRCVELDFRANRSWPIWWKRGFINCGSTSLGIPKNELHFTWR